MLNENPETLPEQTRGLFDKHQNTINNALVHVRGRFAKFSALNCTGSSSNDVEKSAKQKATRIFLAKSLDTEMKAVEKELVDIEAKLQHQFTRLITTLKIDDMQCDVRRDLRELRLSTESAEFYCTRHFVPPVQDNLYLEFNPQDENGTFSAPEGKLKSTVFSSTMANSVIAARGAERP